MNSLFKSDKHSNSPYTFKINLAKHKTKKIFFNLIIHGSEEDGISG